MSWSRGLFGGGLFSVHGAYHAKEQRPKPSTLLPPSFMANKLSRVEGVGGGQGIDTKVRSLDLQVNTYPSSLVVTREKCRYPPRSMMPLIPRAESGGRRWGSATVLQEK